MQVERLGRKPPPVAEAEESLLLRINLPGGRFAVRRALAQVTAVLAPLPLTDGCRDSAELVLAEVLNNVVEHAYPDATGPILLELRLCGGDSAGTLDCTVVDRGLPMPDGTPPPGAPLILDVPLCDLPEGGFGWFLIRSLTQDLHYVRETGGNSLSFRIALERQRG